MSKRGKSIESESTFGCQGVKEKRTGGVTANG